MIKNDQLLELNCAVKQHNDVTAVLHSPMATVVH